MGDAFSSEACFEKTDPNTIFADFCALKSLLGRHDPSHGMRLSLEVIAEVCGFKRHTVKSSGTSTSTFPGGV